MWRLESPLAQPVDACSNYITNNYYGLLSCRGGTKQLGLPELQKAMDRRKLDRDGETGSRSTSGRTENQGSALESELAKRLKEQTEKLKKVVIF